MKTLLLIRHAKSSWKDLALTDKERPLNKRGLRDAPRIGAYLKELKIRPNLIISSPANRAHTTAKTIAEVLDYPQTDIVVKEEFYTFGILGEDIIQALSKLEQEMEVVMIFGHNPTFTSLANRFSGSYFDNVPTCGVVCLQFDMDGWSEIEKAKSREVFHIFPKML